MQSGWGYPLHKGLFPSAVRERFAKPVLDVFMLFCYLQGGVNQHYLMILKVLIMIVVCGLALCSRASIFFFPLFHEGRLNHLEGDSAL